MKLSQNDFIITCSTNLTTKTETKIHDQVNVSSITKINSWLKFLGKKSPFGGLCNFVLQK